MNHFLKKLNNAKILICFVFLIMFLHGFDIISKEFAANICFILSMVFLIDSIWGKNE